MADTCSNRAPLRLAFVLSSFPGGGLERVTLSLMQGLLGYGHAVDLVLERRSGAYLAELPDGVRCIALSSGSKWRACARLARVSPREGADLAYRMLARRKPYIPLGRLDSLVGYIERDRPDVVIAAAGRMPFLTLWAQRIATSACRFVVAEHSTFSAREAAVKQNSAAYGRMRYRRTLIRRLYAGADAIVAVSDGVASDIARIAGLSPSAITRIYNPVVDPMLRARAAEDADHPWYAGSPLPPVILAAGRLAPEKAFDVLIEAFAAVVARQPAVRLLIAGEGPERERLERRVVKLGLTASVSLPGWVANPYALMARSALFVSSSRFEGLPVGLIEALACGCPVVATDCPSGPREILKSGRYGRLVPVDDVSALATAMQDELAESSALVAQRRLRGADFGSEPAVAAYERLIRRLVDGKAYASGAMDE